VRRTDGWRLVELEDGSSSRSDPEDQVYMEALHISIRWRLTKIPGSMADVIHDE
jgi:hypothetical protein